MHGSEWMAVLVNVPGVLTMLTVHKSVARKAGVRAGCPITDPAILSRLIELNYELIFRMVREK